MVNTDSVYTECFLFQPSDVRAGVPGGGGGATEEPVCSRSDRERAVQTELTAPPLSPVSRSPGGP